MQVIIIRFPINPKLPSGISIGYPSHQGEKDFTDVSIDSEKYEKKVCYCVGRFVIQFM